MAEKKPARTNRGTFAPGTSGNPSGKAKPRQDAAEVRPAVRNDGWMNFFSGHGVYGRDKRQGTSFKAATLTFDQLSELWRGDDLAARAVETLPKEALREGYDLSIPEAAQFGEDEAERIAEIMDKLSALGANEMIQTGLCYERGLGGGVVMIGANDGQADLTKPLDINRIRSLDWLTPLEPREITPVFGYADPRAPKYGQPEIYRIASQAVLPPSGGQYTTATMDIHESRLLVFPGIRVSRYQSMAAQGGWGDSVLVRMWRVLRDFNLAWGSAGALVTEFASATYKMKDLWQALASKGGAAAFAERLQAMDLARSTINATVIDGDDDFKREQTPISGLPDLMDKFSTRLAAAADMPLTLLFGTSPAGLNATGESDIRFFYDRVAAFQRNKVLPQLKTLIRILFRTLGSKVEPEKWDVEFKPLWQESAKERADAMLTQAQADSAWIDRGVLSAEEVADAHWGTGKWVPDLRIDFEARERQEAAAAGPVSQQDFAAMGRGPNGERLPPGQAPGQGGAPGQAPGQPGQPPTPGAAQGRSGFRTAPALTQRGQGADEDLDERPRSMVLSNDSEDRPQLRVVHEDEFDPSEARDKDGKWTGNGEGHTPAATSAIQGDDDDAKAEAEAQREYAEQRAARAARQKEKVPPVGTVEYWDHYAKKWGHEAAVKRATEAFAGGILGRDFLESGESFIKRNSTVRATKEWLDKNRKRKDNFDPSEPRDEDGQWSGNGSGGGGVNKAVAGAKAQTHELGEKPAHAPAETKATEHNAVEWHPDPRESAAQHKAKVAAYAAKLTREEVHACRSYGMFASVINGELRAGRPPTDAVSKHAVAVLDSAISKGRMDADMMVYRGIKSSLDPLAHLKPGTIITDKGYVSTSGSRGTAETFATSDTGDTGTHVIVRIKVPKGHIAAPVPTTFLMEKEYLLPRGSRFKINSVATDGDHTVVDAEAL